MDVQSNMPEDEAEHGTVVETSLREANPALRMVLFVSVVCAGIAGAAGLSLLREPPKTIEQLEPSLTVEAREAVSEDVTVVVEGYGEARALNVTQIIPEVAGRVVETHPRLYEGEVIPKGELLFKIDPRDYIAARDSAQAQAAQMRDTLARLKIQFDTDTSRMDTVRRSSELALADFDRARTLFVQDQVGTQSAVDAAERAYNQAKDARDLLDQSLRTYPARLREAQSALDAAEAQAALARTRLERTEIRVDFDARIKQKNIERDQYAAPGAAALVLANDEALEISVPLDSRDAREWLEFAPADGDGGISWFGRPAPAVCVIHWTEDKDGPGWQGALDRVERFDETTRTVTVAIRITAEQARGGGGLPLVDGMFCEVAIPGKTMRHVFRLPRWAVSFEENVYLAVNGRLQVRKVETVRNQGEEVFVSSGLEAGDLVIVTRLVNPLPNSLVEIAAQESPGSAAGGPVEPVHAEKAQ